MLDECGWAVGGCGGTQGPYSSNYISVNKKTKIVGETGNLLMESDYFFIHGAMVVSLEYEKGPL